VPSGESEEAVISTAKTKRNDDQYKRRQEEHKNRTECLIFNGKPEHGHICGFHGALQRESVREMRQNRGTTSAWRKKNARTSS
jgi:hypothetical protein